MSDLKLKIVPLDTTNNISTTKSELNKTKEEKTKTPIKNKKTNSTETPITKSRSTGPSIPKGLTGYDLTIRSDEIVLKTTIENYKNIVKWINSRANINANRRARHHMKKNIQSDTHESKPRVVVLVPEVLTNIIIRQKPGS